MLEFVEIVLFLVGRLAFTRDERSRDLKQVDAAVERRPSTGTFALNGFKEVPLLAILTRNIGPNFSPGFLLICEYDS